MNKKFLDFVNDEYSGSMFDVGDIVKIQFDSDSIFLGKIGEIISKGADFDDNKLFVYKVKFKDGSVKDFLYYQMKLIEDVKESFKKFKVGDKIIIKQVMDFRYSVLLNKVGKILEILPNNKYKIELDDYILRKNFDSIVFNENQLEFNKDSKKINVNFRESIFNGDFAKMVQYLNQGADPNFENGFPLIYSCAHGRLHSVNFLIKKGANVNIREGSPLIEASREGHFNVIESLLNYNANPRVQKDKALRLASENGHIGVVRQLVNVGCRLKEIDVENLIKKNDKSKLEPFFKDLLKSDPDLYDILGRYFKFEDKRSDDDDLYIIGFPSGQIIELTRAELNRLKKSDLVSIGKIKRYQNVEINNYGFKDENFKDIIDALLDMQMMDGDVY